MPAIKLQFACLMITFFIYVRYEHLSQKFSKTSSAVAFVRLLRVALIEAVLDLATAYSVNCPSIPLWVNHMLHWLFFLSIDSLLYFAYLYFLASLPEGNTHTKDRKVVNVLYVLNMVVVTVTMPFVYYVKGASTNYSMGLPVYACFVIASIYVVLLGCKLLMNWREVSGSHKANVITIAILMTVVALIQYFIPEALVTSLFPAILSLTAYMNREDPIRVQFELDRKMSQGDANRVEENGIGDEQGEIIEIELSRSTHEKLTFNHMHFIYAEALGNYTNLCIVKDGVICTEQLRLTIKRLEKSLNPYPRLMRVHRSFIVNLDRVIKVNGSCAGGKLFLEGVDTPISVSRTYNSIFQQNFV